MKTTIRVKLVAIQKGFYTNYIFENPEEPYNSEFKFLTVTKCPNWQNSTPIKCGDIGYLEYEYVEAGENYFNKSTGKQDKYYYSANYFMNFIKDEIEDVTKEYKL